MSVALYFGNFNPVASGHIDVAGRAAAIFDRLVIGVYDLSPQQGLFSIEERVTMFAKAMEQWPNVTVMGYNGLTVNFAQEVGATVLVRGLRAMNDFELELQSAMLNRKLAPNIETVCFMIGLDKESDNDKVYPEIRQLRLLADKEGGLF